VSEEGPEREVDDVGNLFIVENENAEWWSLYRVLIKNLL
jgi:hypothetical protein